MFHVTPENKHNLLAERRMCFTSMRERKRFQFFHFYISIPAAIIQLRVIKYSFVLVKNSTIGAREFV